MTLTAATSPPDYAAFLRDQYALQTPNVASYRLGPEQVWLKKAGPRHSMARYRVLGLLAWLTRLQVLRPVPNLGGSAAIATEARRLHSLAALGLACARGAGPAARRPAAAPPGPPRRGHPVV
jgi:hypothetical protein